MPSKTYFDIQRAVDDVNTAIHEAAVEHGLEEDPLFHEFIAAIVARLARDLLGFATDIRVEAQKAKEEK